VKHLFLLLIALVIPLFFLGVFVLSEYHKLAALRRRSQAAATQPDPALARQTYQEAAREYAKARQHFPTNLIAALFGFPPARPFSADTTPSQPAPKEPPP